MTNENDKINDLTVASCRSIILELTDREPGPAQVFWNDPYADIDEDGDVWISVAQKWASHQELAEFIEYLEQ